MSIDFHTEQNRYTYAGRVADEGWARAVLTVVDPRGKRVADIGCGGGIYSRAWAGLGAASVIGVDVSAQMVAAAREKSAGMSGLAFQQGTADASGLADASADLVFERALIHHLPDYDACFAEAFRVLAPGGLLLVQDRRPDDVALPGSAEHLRGYFFERFPRLLAVETGRRPTDERVRASLARGGFQDIASQPLWEVRKTHDDVAALEADLLGRTGRSILHELDDAELRELTAFIGERVGAVRPIVEKDRWTLWAARKPRA
ncbi:class I SAM-dependent methyltransferase [Achromobacter sp. Marseille-Q0513]|uniref:class I SAM-dependent methyltransferase n=1 Tax=Achromobacter sp. Marseille-Q0513 TaxID=2829161 RepID=UPI001B98C1AB|nr:class I SAM-dependent methyltransferase [Achromobacter sp. Marseille-Q0513]MBR8657680.1 class I SAM-dependent methyltransferase [Achromobacter sp. Marseille-Q0513]